MLFESYKKNNILFYVLIVILLLLISVINIFKLTEIPKGLYQDESDIAYNAALIAKTGHDEHNAFMPLYFRSFDDYKSPVYIYTMSFIFKVFGISYFNLKFTSFLYYLIFVISIMVLANNMFNKSKKTVLYALLGGAFLPGYFLLGHIGFEIVSQPVFFILSLIFLYKSFYKEEITNKKQLIYALIAGLVIGLSTYTYPTARMLSFVMLFIFFIFHLNKKFIKKDIFVLIGAAIAITPYMIYSISSFSTLLQRFNGISYTTDGTLTIFEKLSIFEDNYLSYFKPSFLMIFGDPNMRHSTNLFGIIPVAVFLLSVFALFYIIYSKKLFKDRFLAFVTCFLFCSPLAAALTNDKFHTLRNVLFCISLFLISIYGFYFLFEILKKYKLQNVFLTVVFVSLIGQSAYYLYDYFNFYPAKSAHAFEYYGIEDHLADISKIKPDELNYHNIGLGKSNIDFYNQVYRINFPVIEKLPESNIKNCILFNRDSESIIKAQYPDYIKFNSQGNMIFLAVHKDLALNIDFKKNPTGFYFDSIGNEKYQITYLNENKIIFEEEYFVQKSTDEYFERNYVLFNDRIFKEKINKFKIKPLSDKGRIFNIQITKAPDVKSISDVNKPIHDGIHLNDANAYIFMDKDLLIDLKKKKNNSVINISTDENNTYMMLFYNNKKEVGRYVVKPFRNRGGFTKRTIEISEAIVNEGYDKILITPLYGDNYYYLGHIIF
jgi:4-amino-4-deoxy-L-arabinose transferase-like glycosyltransferase